MAETCFDGRLKACLAYLATGLALTSEDTLIEAPSPGASIKVSLETVPPSPRHTLFVVLPCDKCFFVSPGYLAETCFDATEANF
jgi:hypothetical protein